jgi:hypothetical protein
MLRSKLSRHTFAFVAIAVASIALYPAAQAENRILIGALLAVISAAALLTILTKS